MEYLDKHGILPQITEREHVVIELGCGNSKHVESAIGVDLVDLPAVDIIADITQGLAFIPDASVDELHAYHLLEHLEDTGQIMTEIYRVLKPGGLLVGAVPHWSNPYYYSDYTHRRFFGLYSFSYFTKKQSYRRRVPAFYNELDFRAKRIKLVFWSPFRWLNVFRRVYTWVFNVHPFMQEMYEGSFSNIFAMHEIQFTLEKK